MTFRKSNRNPMIITFIFLILIITGCTPRIISEYDSRTEEEIFEAAGDVDQFGI